MAGLVMGWFYHVFYTHIAPLGLWVGQDARPTGMDAGYGIRSMPTTII